MKKIKIFFFLVIALFICGLSACSVKNKKENPPPTLGSSDVSNHASNNLPKETQLPVRYQNPGYVVPTSDDEKGNLGDKDEFSELKVGATIKSTGGPIPLVEILKKLAAFKKMNVSYNSDVNRFTSVDVDISADDSFFDAISNIIRQADYYYELNDKTIIIGNKKTKTYQIGVPFMAGGYNTTVGGNFLTTKSSTTGTEGIIKITSNENKFDIWDNIEKNLQVILGVIVSSSEYVSSVEAEQEKRQRSAAENANLGEEGTTNININEGETGKSKLNSEKEAKEKEQFTAKLQKLTRQTAEDGSFFVIDKSVGLITVTAKPNVLKNVDDYLDNLKKELYRQVIIEAKIIEVYLEDNSRIGLDWSSILKNFSISGTTFFGTAGFGNEETGVDGQVYPWIETKGDVESPTRFISKVALSPVSFNVMLNALNEQGDTHVLANPKITVLNGQPALISVGRDIAYISTVEKDVDTETNEITYTAKTDNVVEGVALGVMASIVGDNKAVLHLTPLTTNLKNGTVEYRTFGDEGLQIGLPEVSVRQMSTMVEVENGEMLIIGGLIDSVEGSKGSFAPLVGSIPIVKYLFGVEEKTKEKRELVISLTPRII